MVQLENYDLITIMEKWWDELQDWNILIKDYKLFRKDRQGRRCGVVVLYVKKWIDCQELPLRNSYKQVESLLVKIKDWNKKGHFVVGVYCRLLDQGKPVEPSCLSCKKH